MLDQPTQQGVDRGLANLAIGDMDQVIVDLDESIEICRSTGAKVIEWEAHINYCLLEIERDDKERVQEEYNTARSVMGNSKYNMRNSDLEKISVSAHSRQYLTG